MMRWIVESSMQLRLLIVAAGAGLIFFGITELRNMPVDVVPEFSQPIVEIQTEALGLSAEEVEAMITVPLEADMLNGVSWVDQIRSESIPGLSSIVMAFEPGTNVLHARQMVQERLLAAHTLPSVSQPPAMLQPLSSTNRFLKVGLTSDERSLIELSVLARWTIVPRLMGVPGVANASIWGQRRRQLQVQVDPEVLREQKVTLHRVIEATGNALWASPLSFLNASTPGTGGWIETPNQRLGVQHLSPISTSEDLAQVSVEGTLQRLGELATVVENHQPLIGDALVNDEPALMLVVEKFPWASTVEVTHAVEEALGALKPGLPSVEMDSSLFRPATYLKLAMDNLSSALLGGALLVVVAFFGLLGSWRTALIGTLAVLFSMLAAGAVLYVAAVPINMMIIAGLIAALAAIIDDAILAVGHIADRLRENRESSTGSAIAAATLEMRGPLVYATLIALLIVAPVYFLQGVAGAFSVPIALAYALALGASFLVALTVTPALAVILQADGGLDDRPTRVLEGLQNRFEGILSRTLEAGGERAVPATVAAVGAAGLVAALAFPPSGESLLPHFRERDILVELEGTPGTSEIAMRRIVSRATKELRSISGVRNVSAHMGRAVLSDRITDVDTSELWVSLEPAADYDTTVAAIEAIAAGYPGFDVDVDTFLSDRIRDEADIDDPLVVRIYGEDLGKIQSKAEQIQRLISRINGVVDAEIEAPNQQPTVEIEVNLAKAKEHGLKPGDVRRAVTTLMSGIEVGNLFEEQKVFDVVVWSTPEHRRSMSDLENMLIDTPPPWPSNGSRRKPVLGGHVRLSEVADIRIAPAPRVIHRESVARHIDVTADVQGRDLAELNAEVADRIRREVGFPLEYRAEVLGAHANQVAATQTARAFAIAAAIAIVLLLQAAFGSWRLSILFFLSLPVALVGGALASFAGSTLGSLGSVLGLVAVFGIATRWGMTLIAHYRRLEGIDGAGFSSELIQRATADRFVPIVTSAIIVALAFLPLAALGGDAGREILHPMALTVLGGLVTATLVSLFVLPSLYLRFGAEREAVVIVEE